MDKIAIYPGSFDPWTLGHQSVVTRSLKIFDKVIIAVATNSAKQPTFTFEERATMIRSAIGHHRVSIQEMARTALLVQFAKDHGATAIIRGLRAVSDFEYELHMANANYTIAPEIDTFFMMTEAEHFFVSSTIVKEIARLGGPIDKFVPKVNISTILKAFGRFTVDR